MLRNHYKSEKREIKNRELHWRASFPSWVKEQMERIERKRARGEKISEGESAIQLAWWFMNRPENLERLVQETVNVSGE